MGKIMKMEMSIGWMNRRFRHGCGGMLSFILALCMGVSISPLRAGDERVAASKGKERLAADYSDPLKTYRTFMEAIKRDDLAAAEACCTIADDNKSGSLDVLVGMWVAFHHFNKVALEHFKDDVQPYLEVGGADQKDNPYLRRDCTDQALERTISRLPGSKFRIKGDKAWLKIKWGDKEYDDLNPAFFYSGNEEQQFHKVQGLWKLDLIPDGVGSEELGNLFKPGSWGRAFHDGMQMFNAVAQEIESGKLKTWKQVAAELEKRKEVIEREWIKDHDDTIPENAKPSSHTKDQKAGTNE